MNHPCQRALRAGRRAYQDEDINVHQEIEGLKRRMDFLVDHQTKLAALVADKQQLDVSQLPQFDEGQPSGVQEPDEEIEEEEEEMDSQKIS